MTMSRSLLILTVVVSIAICPSWSGAAEDDITHVLSFEDTSCGAWARSQSDKYRRQVYLYWFRGFVSGYNFENRIYQVTLNSMPDQDTLSLYVDKFCRENPLSQFVAAAFPLVRELRVKK